MTEREKVIKGLELCIGNILSAGCPEECPYYEACQNYEKYVVFQPVMKDALELLKAQEPKQVYITGQTSGIKVGMCPNCGNAISSEGSSHFCGKCGQAVKWDG